MANNQIKLILETELKGGRKDLSKLETAGAFHGDVGTKNLTKLYGLLQRMEAVDLKNLSGKELTSFLNTMSKFRSLLDTAARGLSSYTAEFKKQQQVLDDAKKHLNIKRGARSETLRAKEDAISKVNLGKNKYYNKDTGREVTKLDTIINLLKENKLEIRNGDKVLGQTAYNNALQKTGLNTYAAAAERDADAKKEVTAQEAVVKAAEVKLDEIKKLSAADTKITPVTSEIQQASANTEQNLQKVRDLSDESSEENIKKTTTAINNQSVSIERQSSSLGRAFKQFTIYNMALRATKTAVNEAVKTVQELDKYLTEQAMVTGMSREETYRLVGTYQDLAIQCGATTKEIAQVSTEYMKQGKTVKESLVLTEAAVKAAKVARVSVGDSVNYLTTALNGFRLSAEDAMKVSDKFAAVAASSATDYDELAIALSKVASQANLAGMSIDYTTALLTKGLETTREAPETMGTALKTIIARMRELGDYGETLEGDTDINNVESQLAYVGIALRDTNGELRSTEDVLDELGKKWDTLNKNQQAALAKALAGTRQQSRLIAIMEDYERVTELQEISQRSAGATAAQAGVYLEGMEASLNKIQVAWEKIVMNLSNSKVIVGAFSAVGSILDSVGDMLDTTAEQIPIFTTLAIIGASMLGQRLQENALAKEQNQLDEQNKLLQQEKLVINNELAIAQAKQRLEEEEGANLRNAIEAERIAQQQYVNALKTEEKAIEDEAAASEAVTLAEQKVQEAELLQIAKEQAATEKEKFIEKLKQTEATLLEKQAAGELTEKEKNQLQRLQTRIGKEEQLHKTLKDEAKVAKNSLSAHKGKVTSAKKALDIAKQNTKTAKDGVKTAKDAVKTAQDDIKVKQDEYEAKAQQIALDEKGLELDKKKLAYLDQQSSGIWGIIKLYNNLKGIMLLFEPIYAAILFFQRLINAKKREEYILELKKQHAEATGLKKKLLAAQIQMAESVAANPVWGWAIAIAILAAAGIAIGVAAAKNIEYGKSAEGAADRINELSNEIYKLNEKATAIDNITSSFDKLDSKLIKTKADLEEMNSLLEKGAESMDNSEVDEKKDVGFGKGVNEKQAYEAMTDDEKKLYLKRKSESLKVDLKAARGKQESEINNLSYEERSKLFDENTTNSKIIQAQAAIYALNNAELYEEIDLLKKSSSVTEEAAKATETLTQSLLENLTVTEAWEYNQNPDKIKELISTVSSLKTQVKDLSGEMKELSAVEVLDSEDYSLKDRVEAYKDIRKELVSLGQTEILESFTFEYSGFEEFTKMSAYVLDFIDSVGLSVDEINKLYGAWSDLQKAGIDISQKEWESKFNLYMETLAATQGDVLTATKEVFGEYLDGSEETLNAFIAAYGDLVQVGILNMGQNMDKVKNSINSFYEKALEWNEMSESDKAEFIQDNADLFSDGELLKAFESGNYNDIEEALKENKALQKQIEQRKQEVAQELLIERARTGDDRNEAYIAELERYEKYLNDTENMFKASLEVRLEQERAQLDEYKALIEERQKAEEGSLEKRKDAYEKYFDALTEEEDEEYEEQADLLVSNLSKLGSTANASTEAKTKELEQKLEELEEERLKELRERAQEAIIENIDDELAAISDKFDKLLDSNQALLLAMQGELDNTDKFLTDMISNKIVEGGTSADLEEFINSLKTTYGSVFGDKVDWDMIKETVNQLFLNVNGQTINLTESEQQNIYEIIYNAITQLGKR